MNDELRKKVRLIKALQGITYKEIAEYLDITVNSLYNWLRCQYDLSLAKQKVLQEEIGKTADKLNQLKTAQSKLDPKDIENNSQEYRKLQREIITTEEKLKQLNYEASNSKKWSDTFQDISNKLGTLGSKLEAVGSKLTKTLTLPILGVATAGAKLNAELEKNETAFETFLGSTEEAQKVVAEIRQDASKSLFDTSSLLKANQMLISTGESAEDARETINALGNAVLATGGGNDELTRMASNLQQVKNARKSNCNGYQTICICWY